MDGRRLGLIALELDGLAIFVCLGAFDEKDVVAGSSAALESCEGAVRSVVVGVGVGVKDLVVVENSLIQSSPFSAVIAVSFL
jgi:hypothetical protein